MRVKLFYFITLLSLSFSAWASTKWLYYEKYPWVYDYNEKVWLYLRGAADNKVYAYHAKDKTWGEFKAEQDDNSDFADGEEIPKRYLVKSANNLEMLRVEPGSFLMGSPIAEPGRSGDEAQYQVTLSKQFYLGIGEVTQLQYEAVMTGNPEGLDPTPSRFSGYPNRPVEKVSWQDTQVFLAHLNSAEKAAGRLTEGWSYALPTEAEWEYACRAGTTSVYPWGDLIESSNANYSSSGISHPLEYGKYSANQWGFFDMNGNVWEWTEDKFGDYPTSSTIDPIGSETGSNRVRRGGAMNTSGSYLRSAERSYASPSDRKSSLGFRLSLKQIQ